jgi:hypothetical protein
MISSHAAIWRERFTLFWEESLDKHPHSCSWCRSGSSSCVKRCMRAGAPSFKSAGGAGSTRPQWLLSSRPIYSLVCASKYRKARLSCKSVVQRWGLLHPRGIFNSHVWAEANPHAASVHCHKQCFVVNNWAGIVTDFLNGPYLLLWCLNAQIYHVLLEERLSEMPEEIPLSVKRNVVPAQWGCSSLCTSGPKTSHLHLQCSPDWTGWDNGLASQVTRPRTTLKPWFTHHQLILWFWRSSCPTVEAVAAIRQQSGIFKHTCQSLLGHRLCIKLSGHTFDHPLFLERNFFFSSPPDISVVWLLSNLSQT